MNISDLTSNFTDFLRPNLYLTYIMPKKRFADFENLGLICNEATFPYHTFNTTDTFYNNRNYSFVNKIDYDPATFSFFVDKFNKTFKFFDAWNKQIIDENFMLGFYDDYVAQIDIELIDRLGDVAAIATLIDAFPVNINSIALSYGENDSVMNMQVSFKFREISYEFIDRPKQQKLDVSNLSYWKDLFTVGNLRKGVNMISKLKNYRYMIENGNVYDIVSQAGSIFSGIKSSRAGSSIESAVNIFKNVEPKVDKGYDMVSKVKGLF